MEVEKALQIVSLLADGIDPSTGEMFPPESPYQNPETVRALMLAATGLKRRNPGHRSRSLPGNVGRPWTAEQENALVEAFEQGKGLQEIAVALERTTRSLEFRLVKLGKMPAQALADLERSQHDAAGGSFRKPSQAISPGASIAAGL